ncbi:MAG: signal peptidase I [Erysipelotrichaceae bacterium]|nr:signal peptidase I [Erysipelotrichaceae bacterium]
MNPDAYSKIIRKRRLKIAEAESWKSIGIRLLTVTAIVGILFSTVFFLTRVRGISMMPSIHDGDLLLGYRLSNKYAKDDIVQYQHDGQTYIGRIVGMPGDIIRITEEGQVLINGSASDENLFKTEPGTALQYPCTVLPDTYFILGDYRTNAKDSREFGTVSKEDVEGKIITLLRRRNL